jgi:hypothetical protein
VFWLESTCVCETNGWVVVARRHVNVVRKKEKQNKTSSDGKKHNRDAKRTRREKEKERERDYALHYISNAKKNEKTSLPFTTEVRRRSGYNQGVMSVDCPKQCADMAINPASLLILLDAFFCFCLVSKPAFQRVDFVCCLRTVKYK